MYTLHLAHLKPYAKAMLLVTHILVPYVVKFHYPDLL